MNTNGLWQIEKGKELNLIELHHHSQYGGITVTVV